MLLLEEKNKMANLWDNDEVVSVFKKAVSVFKNFWADDEVISSPSVKTSAVSEALVLEEEGSFVEAIPLFMSTILKKEASDYDTLFGSANKRETPFQGVKVSEMTVGEVLEFTKNKGAFHNYNLKRSEPKNTTAVGKYQTVGGTLRDLKEKNHLKNLGITDDTIFNKKTQDLIASYLIKRAIKDTSGNFKPKEEAILNLKKEWEGLKKLEEQEVTKIYKEVSKLAPFVSLRPPAKTNKVEG
tara:strand:+ start:19015 stop:19737 length:723 start_codon:yes stop_codon:yes gene_type:complete